MAHGPKFWIFVGSSFVLFLFAWECLNAYYSANNNTPKQTALSQVFHTVIGLIGTAIWVSVFAASIVLCFLIVFLSLVMLVMYLAFTSLEIVALGIVVAMALGCIGYALETIALTLMAQSLESSVAKVKDLIRTGITITRALLSTFFVPLLMVPLPWHQESSTTTAPESPLRLVLLTFGTGMRFYFTFRAIPQKEFPPHWKPRPYWGDGLEGDFGVFPFSRKHLNPVLTQIHNNQLETAQSGSGRSGGPGFVSATAWIRLALFQFRPTYPWETRTSLLW